MHSHSSLPTKGELIGIIDHMLDITSYNWETRLMGMNLLVKSEYAEHGRAELVCIHLLGDKSRNVVNQAIKHLIEYNNEDFMLSLLNQNTLPVQIERDVYKVLREIATVKSVPFLLKQTRRRGFSTNAICIDLDANKVLLSLMERGDEEVVKLVLDYFMGEGLDYQQLGMYLVSFSGNRELIKAVMVGIILTGNGNNEQLTEAKRMLNDINKYN